MGNKKPSYHTLFPFFLLLLATIFYFKNLGDWSLWQDEANSAMLSKSILAHGYPRINYEDNYIWPNYSDVSPTRLVWILWGWLPLYCNAFTFLLFGVSTFTARLFSSCLALAFLAHFYYLTKKIFKFRFVANHALMTLVMFVPLALFFRQCGYYSFIVYFSFGAFAYFFYPHLFRHSKILFYLFSMFLLNTHILSFGTLMLSLSLCSLFELKKLKDRFITLTKTFFLSMPFFFLYEVWVLFDRSGQLKGEDNSLTLRVLTYLKMVDLSFFPWFIIFALILATAIARLKFNYREKHFILRASVLSATTILVTSLASRYFYLRYILYIIPFIVISFSICLHKLTNRNLFLGGVLVIIVFVFCSVGLRKDKQGNWNLFSSQFLKEINQTHIDTTKVLTYYLKKNASPQDTIWCNYGEFPLMFYTSLKIRGGAGGLGLISNKQTQFLHLPELKKPDWIIPKRNWLFMYPKKIYENFLKNDSYDMITLPVEDVTWNNRPSIQYHYFQQPKVHSPLIIYRRNKDS